MRSEAQHYDEIAAQDYVSHSQSERGYTGRMHERDLFGEVNVTSQDFQKDMERLGAGANGYLPYNKAIEIAELYQPTDASNPSKDFLKNLLIEVQDRLANHKNITVEGAFTAVNTPLDRFHGTDAFVSGSYRGKKWTVGLDASIRPEKLRDAMLKGQNEKGAIIIGNVISPEENENMYLMQIEDAAKKISEEILGRISADTTGTRTS